MTEKEGELGTGFSVHVARTWQSVFFSQQDLGVQKVALRVAIVLGKGSALIPLKKLSKIGLGGPQGSGKQKFSWIHIHDLFRIIRHIELSDNPKKIYNCSSPITSTNQNLMQIIRSTYGIKWYIPIPLFLLKIGAFIIRTETELVLKSRWVYPKELINEGFVFEYKDLEKGIQHLS